MKGGVACSILAAALLAEHARRLERRGRPDACGRRGEHGLARHRLSARARAGGPRRRQHLRRRRLADGGALRREGTAVDRGRGARRCRARRARAQGRQRHRPAARGARPGEGAGAPARRGARRRHPSHRGREPDIGDDIGCRRVRDPAARDRQHRHHRGRRVTQPRSDARHRQGRHPPARRHLDGRAARRSSTRRSDPSKA